MSKYCFIQRYNQSLFFICYISPNHFGIFHYVPCLQSVDMSSCLPLWCPSISLSVGLCSFAQKRLVLAIVYICVYLLASSSSQITLVVCFPGKFQHVLCAPPSWCLHFWSDPTWYYLLQSQHHNFSWVLFALICSFLRHTFRTVCHCSSDDGFNDFVFQFHGHLPIAHHPGYFLPLHPSYCWHQPVNLPHSWRVTQCTWSMVSLYAVQHQQCWLWSLFHVCRHFSFSKLNITYAIFQNIRCIYQYHHAIVVYHHFPLIGLLSQCVRIRKVLSATIS